MTTETPQHEADTDEQPTFLSQVLSHFATRSYLDERLDNIEANLQKSIDQMGANLLVEMDKRFDAFKQELLDAINGQNDSRLSPRSE